MKAIEKKLSESASNRVGSKNSFYGKSHNDHTKDIISKKNSIHVTAISNDSTLTFASINDAVKFIISNDNSLHEPGVRKRLSNAFKTGDEYVGFIWTRDRTVEQHYSEVSAKAKAENASKRFGLRVTMIDAENHTEFNSLSKAAEYILSIGIDKKDKKTIAAKIKSAANSGDTLYSKKWKFT